MVGEQSSRITLSRELWNRILTALPDSPFIGEPDNLRQRIDALRVVIEDDKKATIQFMWRGKPCSEAIFFERFDHCTFTVDIKHIDASMKIGLSYGE